MTRQEVIKFLKLCPNHKVTHRYFSDNEWLHSKGDGKVYDENGYLFEDWTSQHNCGLRLREGGAWEDGWKAVSIRDKNPADGIHWYGNSLFPSLEYAGHEPYVFSVDVVAYDGCDYFKAYYSFTDQVWFNAETEKDGEKVLAWSYGPNIEE